DITAGLATAERRIHGAVGQFPSQPDPSEGFPLLLGQRADVHLLVRHARARDEVSSDLDPGQVLAQTDLDDVVEQRPDHHQFTAPRALTNALRKSVVPVVDENLVLDILKSDTACVEVPGELVGVPAIRAEGVVTGRLTIGPKE